MRFRGLEFEGGNIGRFFIGDRVRYIGKNHGGPIKGCTGKIVLIDPDALRSIQADTEGEQLYLVEFDKKTGDTYTYYDTRGTARCAKGRGWMCADSMLELETKAR